MEGKAEYGIYKIRSHENIEREKIDFPPQVDIEMLQLGYGQQQKREYHAQQQFPHARILCLGLIEIRFVYHCHARPGP